MFTSHKSDAPPRSRQSSVDSPVATTSSPVSPSGARNSQRTNYFSYGAMQSPEQKHRAYPSKRSSVFNLRARSNTATSSASTTPSLMSSYDPDMTYAQSSRPESPTSFEHAGHQAYVELSGARRSIFRGGRGKRLSTSGSASIVMAECQELDMSSNKRTSVLRKGKEPPGTCFNSSNT